MKLNRKAFTLMELLIGVLIIGILGAIALPQYQRAVLKSRFSGMMPIAKALAEANEVYYLDRGEYAENPADLLVAGRDKNAGAYPDGTKIVMYSDAENLSFVRSENNNIPTARYVVYQKHSKNFPDTTWCEAKDTHAEEVCVALGGQLVEGGSSSGATSEDNNWKAYILSGTAREGDSFAGAGSGGSGAGTGGTSTAPALDPETLAKLEALANLYCPANSQDVCTIKNGTLHKCYASRGTVDETGECVSNGTLYSLDYPYENIYDENGNQIAYYQCITSSNKRCYEVENKIPTKDGYKLVRRRCANSAAINKEGICSNGYVSGTEYIYDSHGHQTSWFACSASAISTETGACGAYDSMTRYENNYDTDGNYTGRVIYECTNIDPTTGTKCLEWTQP